MVTGLQHEKVKAIKIDFADEAVTAFGGLALAERLALRAGLWRRLEQQLPERRGYSWLTILKSVIVGLLSGSRATYAAEELRQDEALIALLGLEERILDLPNISVVKYCKVCFKSAKLTPLSTYNPST